MKLPRLSIAAIMTLIVLVALDFAVIARAVSGGNELMLLVLGAVPMENILVIAAAVWLRPAAPGEATPFLTPFLVVGTFILIGFVALVRTAPSMVMEFMGRTIIVAYSKLLHRLGIREATPIAIAIGIPIYVGFFTLPQVLLASATGWANRRLQSRNLQPGEADANRPAPSTSSML